MIRNTLRRPEVAALRLADQQDNRQLLTALRQLAYTATIKGDPMPAAQLRELAGAALILARRMEEAA